MSHNRTLHCALEHAGLAGAELVIARHCIGPAQVTVRLVLARTAGRAGAVAVAPPPHTVRSFSEVIDAGDVAERRGERALDRALTALRFESGLTPALTNWNDLAALAPAMLDN
jgi:hypothetical protein